MMVSLKQQTLEMLRSVTCDGFLILSYEFNHARSNSNTRVRVFTRMKRFRHFKFGRAVYVFPLAHVSDQDKIKEDVLRNDLEEAGALWCLYVPRTDFLAYAECLEFGGNDGVKG